VLRTGDPPRERGTNVASLKRTGANAMTAVTMPSTAPLTTDIPFRLDRLPWSSFHWLLIVSLGVTWILDGLEATVVGSIGPTLEKGSTLGLSHALVGWAGTIYLAGAILGALVFGYLTDRLGRKRLFTVTLLVYLCGALSTALSWNFFSFALFRFVTGLAIGGEYAAINSAIDELIPARLRGRVDLIVNGTYWIGAAAGAGVTELLLNRESIPDWLGWRIAFGLGGVLGCAIIVARQYVPESPRWLLTHGREDEAEAIMNLIERRAAGHVLAPVTERITIYPGAHVRLGVIVRTLLVKYRRRAVLGLVLIASQAFFYNGLSFTYPLVLHQFFGVPASDAPRYMLYFALANFAGPLVLGRLFDTVGRRVMIAGTYAIAGTLIVANEVFFRQTAMSAETQTLFWCVAFFFASAAASAGYLTVSEIFPVEMRAMAIALFYVVGTTVGGLTAPALFGALIETGRMQFVSYGYLLGALLMLIAAAVEALIGVDAERRGLESIAKPLTAEAPSSRDAA
jgi:MFS family permease